MDDKTSKNSKVLMDINPDARDTKLIVNKDIRTLEDLRKNFNPVQSSVLSQVRDFLPKLATANEDLQRRLEADPDYSADIEQLDDAEAPHIEMNLALMEAEYSSDDDSVDSDTSSDDSSDDNNDDSMCGEVNENNIKMPKEGVINKHGKQLIQVVDRDNASVPEGSLNDPMITPDEGTYT
ncbi:NOP protein chaperone 1-like [Mercenaria mercenaria]|uniref:NOP protein chaperone 1-like n=1 Tax=Mercenaria mercenaria TaxID=6596 RepID=UPI00234F8008|nr:NOP protein chaperone 1-like [Mercenaria mercenaria]